MKASSPSGINGVEAAREWWPTRWGGRSSGESLPRGGFGSSRGNGAESSKRSGSECGSPIKRQGSGGGRSHDAKWARAAVSASTGRGGWRLGKGADMWAQRVSDRGKGQRLPMPTGPAQQERREEGKGKVRGPKGKRANGPNRKEVKESE
jgi:hypothetical protein